MILQCMNRFVFLMVVNRNIPKLLVSALILVLMNCTLMYNPFEQVSSNSTTVVYSTAEDKEYETVFELVTEEWLDIEDCVPEQDNGNDCDGHAKAKTFDWYPHCTAGPAEIISLLQNHIYTGYLQSVIPADGQSPSTPPPDVA